MVTITPIPHNGWQDEHIGQEVTLMLPLGTVFTDIIIAIPFENRFLIGTSTEIGMFVARMQMILPIVEAQDAFIMQHGDEDEDDDDEVSA